MTTLTDPVDATAPVEILGGPAGPITVEIIPQGDPEPADSAPRAADSPSEAIP